MHSLTFGISLSVLEPCVQPVESASQMTEENLSVAASRLGYQWLLVNDGINKYINK